MQFLTLILQLCLFNKSSLPSFAGTLQVAYLLWDGGERPVFCWCTTGNKQGMGNVMTFTIPATIDLKYHINTNRRARCVNVFSLYSVVAMYFHTVCKQLSISFLLSAFSLHLGHWFVFTFGSEDSLFQLRLHHKCKEGLRLYEKHLGHLFKTICVQTGTP